MSDKGVIINFDEASRNALLRGKAEIPGFSFSDTLSVPDLKIKKRHIALLSFSEGQIDYMCIITRKNRVVTAKYRVEFTNLLSLQGIKISEIEETIRSNVRQYFISSSSGLGGVVPEVTWRDLLVTIKTLRPELISDIERVETQVKLSGFLVKGGRAKLLMQEREAFASALDIFSGTNELRKEVFDSWTLHREEIATIDNDGETLELNSSHEGGGSFLDGISPTYFSEESALQHDLINWPEEFIQHVTGKTTFGRGDRRLDVIYANRNVLEKTLGVDLIYYKSSFDLFALVQYKLMSSDSIDNSTEIYYRPDKQFDIELERMNNIVSHFTIPKELNSHEDFRLSNDGFFFKFIPNTGFRVGSHELMPGIYIAREYANFLVGESGPRGKRGGKRISKANSPRHLSNTEFAMAINRGWIGTNGANSDLMKSVITDYFKGENALMVALESGNLNSGHT